MTETLLHNFAFSIQRFLAIIYGSRSHQFFYLEARSFCSVHVFNFKLFKPEIQDFYINYIVKRKSYKLHYKERVFFMQLN